MPKQNPFSLYDFLGYLIPGYASLLLCQLCLSIFLPVDQIPTLSIKNANATELANIAIISYVAGHLFNYISSITVEHYSTRTIGYPTRYLLGDGVFKSYLDTKDEELETQRRILRLLISLSILPICIADFLLDKTLSIRSLYAKKLDAFLITTIKTKINEMLKLEGVRNYNPTKNNDIHRLIYHYITEHSTNHFGKTQNYVAIYGLLRSFSLLASLLTLVLIAKNIEALLIYDIEKLHFSMINLICISSSFMASYLFYLAFVKFYRRFTLESLMALTAIISTKSRSETTNPPSQKGPLKK
ncbi:hypothetical protein [Chromobacterium sp. Panama]|uniref:hypothetical protein n=1 Tax=Chromobacterium sp. Panama TaxID=2161826 RepID=UPI0011B24D5F|nr:hypothetical protein [Chromobacterium sp. Panama]